MTQSENEDTTSIESNDFRRNNLSMQNANSLEFNVKRSALNLTEFNEICDPIVNKKSACEKLKKFKPDLTRKAWIQRVKRLFPIIDWLPKYDLQKCIVADVLVGITVATFQVPQSMYI